MRNKNAVSKNYLSDAPRFAQVCNNQLFGGNQVILPEKLRELDPGELMLKGIRAPELAVLEKYRDVLRIYDDQVMFLILGIENQNEVHYAMPLRQMLYDVLKYENQRAKLEREHRQKKDLRGAEYVSGMAKSDRLIPVITLTIYWGSEPWDGAKSLYEMLDIPPVLSQNKDIINDYRMNLLEVSSMENLEAYSGELKALQEMIMDGRIEGLAEGKARGIAEGKAESVLEFLEELGPVSKELKIKIMEQSDLDVLKTWVKLAANVNSVEEFMNRMS